MLEKKMSLKEKYNQTAMRYDFRYREIQFLKLKLLFTRIHLNSELLLDFGTGTGLFWEYLCKYIKDFNGRFIGIDLSEEMLRLFREKLLDFFKYSNHINQVNHVHLVNCDGESLPFRKNIFNALFAITTLQNLSNITKGIQELERIKMNSAKIGFTVLKKTLLKEELLLKLQILGDPLIIAPVIDEEPVDSEDWVIYF